MAPFYKNVRLLIIIALLFILAIGVFLGFIFSKNIDDGAAPSKYSAVFLTTGDIYFGKLSWFPKPHLTDVWFLQRVVGATGEEQLSIAPFGNAFWHPVNEVYLNSKQIVFWTKLRQDSKVAIALENPESVPSIGDTGNESLPTNIIDENKTQNE